MQNTNEILKPDGLGAQPNPVLATGGATSNPVEAELIMPQATGFTSHDLAAHVAVMDAIRINPLLAFVNRTLDIFGSAGMILLLLPVMLILFLLVAVSCQGSPIFAHRRVGKGGKPFNCFKFRSMCHDAEQRLEQLLEDNPAVRREWMQHHKLANDPRITPLGHLLRQTSLDELPQLFNVLMGDMSLVGPRPIVRAELDHYGRHLRNYLDIKPGLTGLWQVTCRSDSTYLRRVAIDRVYAQNKCLLLDLRILFATVPAVMSRKGAV